MDTEIVIFTAILVAICAFSFIYVLINQKKKTQSMGRILQEIAGKNGKRVTHYDHTGKIAIGMNDKADQLFFYKEENTNGLQERIDLAQVKDCRIQKDWSQEEKGGMGQINLEKLLLVFTFKNSFRKTSSWTFYDSDKDWQMNNEIGLAEKWNLLINNNISEKIKSS